MRDAGSSKHGIKSSHTAACCVAAVDFLAPLVPWLCVFLALPLGVGRKAPHPPKSRGFVNDDRGYFFTSELSHTEQFMSEYESLEGISPQIVEEIVEVTNWCLRNAFSIRSRQSPERQVRTS